jgi:hypothetical protein
MANWSMPSGQAHGTSFAEAKLLTERKFLFPFLKEVQW